jgi:hypothetical protein
LEIRIVLHLNLLIAGGGDTLGFVALLLFFRGYRVFGQ